MDERLLKNLKKVISWGSPHRGAGLYSLRYALTVGHDMIIDDIRFPLQNIGQSTGYQNGVAGIALDAPGIRDLRWDVSKKEMLRLGELLRENTATLNEFPDSELPYGRMFFSDNLKIFNETEGSENGELLQDKYMFYRGVTPKLASLEIDSWFFLWQVYRFAKRATSIEKGAQLNRLVMIDLHKDSDGAAPLYTQGAIDVFPGGGIQRRIFQDVDHEEFYGSEAPQRDESTKDKGRMIAKETFSDLGLTWPRSRCPKLDWVERDETDTLKFEGVFIFPIYNTAEGGDGKPGLRIREIACRADARNADNLQGIVYEVMENGDWNVSVAKSILGSVQDTLFITAVLKDGSEVYGGVKVAGFARVFNRTQRKWYGNIQGAISASVSGDTIMVKPGLYKESIDQISMYQKDLKIWSYDGAASTILESPVARQFNGFVASRHFEITGFTFRNYNDGIILQGAGEDFQKTIKNNVFQNCKRAIHTLQINNVTISDNEFIENEEYAISIFRDYDKTTSDNSFLISGNRVQGGLQGLRLRTGLSLPEAADPFRAQISDNRISQCTGDGIQLNGLVGVRLVFNTITSCQGTGISIRNGSAQATSTLENNEVRQCLTGIDIGNYGQFTLSANTIVSNTETGVLLTLETGNAAIEQNIFQNNSPNGSPGWPTPGLSLWIFDNTVTVNGNQFLSNQNGGIQIASGGGNLSIQQNTFTDNTSDYGGAIYSGGSIKSVVSNVFGSNRAIDGGAFYGRAEQLSGNQFLNNFASNRGGAIKGGASNWPTTATVTVAGQMIQVPRYVPCFAEPTNTYSGNGHGSVFGAWGPGTDNWCQSAGYDVHHD
jgi:predicted outer membrane repeat protein